MPGTGPLTHSRGGRPYERWQGNLRGRNLDLDPHLASAVLLRQARDGDLRRAVGSDHPQPGSDPNRRRRRRLGSQKERSLASPLSPYSPNLVEGRFCELPICGVSSTKFATRKQRPSNTKLRHFEDALPPLNVYAGPTMQRGRAEGSRPYMEGGGNKCCAEGSLTSGDPSYLSDYVGTPRNEWEGHCSETSNNDSPQRPLGTDRSPADGVRAGRAGGKGDRQGRRVVC